MSDDETKRREQQLIVGLFVVLVAASAVVAPMMLNSGEQSVDPKQGSVTTPQPTATPNGQQRVVTRDRPELTEATLSDIPESHTTETASDGGPPVPESVSTSTGAQTMRVATTTVDGSPALQLTDDTVSGGRWISVETAWLRQNLGNVPETVTVAHESDDTYVSKLRVRGESAAFYVEEFSTNVITFGGEITVDGTYQDGSSIAYNLTDVDTAGQITARATGLVNTAWDNESDTRLSSNSILSLDVAGSSSPLSQYITLTGEATTAQQSTTATDVTDGTTTQSGISPDAEEVNDVSVTFNGDSSTTSGKTTSATGVTDGTTTQTGISSDAEEVDDASLTFTGDTTTASGSVSATGVTDGTTTQTTISSDAEEIRSASVTYSGVTTTSEETTSETGAADGTVTQTGISSNAEAIRDGTVTFSGEESTTTVTSSGSGGSSLSVSGNVDASGTLTLEGDGTTTANDASGSVSPSASASIETTGNLDPTGPINGNPALTLTAPSGTQIVGTDYQDSSNDRPMIIGRSGGGPLESELLLNPMDAGDNIKSVSIDIDYNSLSGDETVDVYINTKGINTQYGEGTLVANDIDLIDDFGWTTIPISDYQLSSSSSDVTVEFVTESAGAEDYDRIGINVDAADSPPKSSKHEQDTSNSAKTYGSAKIRANYEPAPRDVTATIDGQTVVFGDFSSGESKTKAVDISSSASTLSLESPTKSMSYTLEKNDRSGSKDPSITLDGTTYSATGIYQEGDIKQFDLTISPGSYTVSTASASGSAPSWSTSLTETIATEDPALDLDGDGTAEVSHSGILKSGQTATASVPDSAISPSTSSVTTTLTDGTVDWSLSYQRVDHTVDPALTRSDGTTLAAYSGVLKSGETATVSIPDSAISSSTSSVTTTLTDGSVDWSLGWTRVDHTVDPALIRSDGSTLAAYSGILTGDETATVAIPDAAISSSTSSVTTTLTDGTVDWTLAWDQTDHTVDPALTLPDGTVLASYSGVLESGQTATVDIPDAAVSSATDSFTTTATGGSVDWTLDYQRVDYTENPTVSLPDGTTVASYPGLLEPGETATTAVNGALSTTTSSLDVQTASATVGVAAQFREVARTDGLTLSVNGNTVSHAGTIGDGETVALDVNESWLQPGVNTVDVSLATLSTDAPTSEVNLDYSHTLSDRVSVTYDGEAFSERYNITRSYASQQQNATLTIPHAGNVLSIRDLDYRIDGGGWQAIPQETATLDGTTLRIDVSALAGEPIPESTTVDIRSTASKVQVDGGSISVLQSTAVGFDLDSRIRLESWSDEASISLGATPQGSLVHYADEESYSAEDDYVSIDSDGAQRLYLPTAVAGSEMTIKNLPVEVIAETNTVELRVPDSSNATNIGLVVSGGPVIGDAWTARYVGGTEGTYYGIVGENGDRLARSQAPDAMTVSRDDVGLVFVEGTQPPSEDKPAGAGAALFSTVGGPTFLPLLVIFGAIGMIGVAGRRPEQSRETVAGLADGLGSLAAMVPVVGEAVAGPIEGLVTSLGNAAISIGESEVAVGGIAVIAAVAAEQANLYSVGPQTAAIGATATVAVGSFIALQRTDSFSLQVWGTIVGATTLVALQTLGQTDLISAVVDSDAFLLIALGAAVLAWRAISAWRASEQAENAPPKITIDAGSSNDNDGGDSP